MDAFSGLPEGIVVQNPSEDKLLTAARDILKSQGLALGHEETRNIDYELSVKVGVIATVDNQPAIFSDGRKVCFIVITDGDPYIIQSFAGSETIDLANARGVPLHHFVNRKGNLPLVKAGRMISGTLRGNNLLNMFRDIGHLNISQVGYKIAKRLFGRNEGYHMLIPLMFIWT